MSSGSFALSKVKKAFVYTIIKPYKSNIEKDKKSFDGGISWCKPLKVDTAELDIKHFILITWQGDNLRTVHDVVEPSMHAVA